MDQWADITSEPKWGREISAGSLNLKASRHTIKPFVTDGNIIVTGLFALHHMFHRYKQTLIYEARLILIYVSED